MLISLLLGERTNVYRTEEIQLTSTFYGHCEERKGNPEQNFNERLPSPCMHMYEDC